MWSLCEKIKTLALSLLKNVYVYGIRTLASKFVAVNPLKPLKFHRMTYTLVL